MATGVPGQVRARETAPHTVRCPRRRAPGDRAACRVRPTPARRRASVQRVARRGERGQELACVVVGKNDPLARVLFSPECWFTVLVHGAGSRCWFTVLVHGTGSRYWFTVLVHGAGQSLTWASPSRGPVPCAESLPWAERLCSQGQSATGASHPRRLRWRDRSGRRGHRGSIRVRGRLRAGAQARGGRSDR